MSAVPFGPGIDIWRSSRFFGTLTRSLCLLPGGLGRFVPCSVGANHCRLRRFWEGCRWGHVDGVYPDLDRAYCRGFSSVPGPLQSVQRAEMWSIILALQSSGTVHLGVDNFGCRSSRWSAA